MNKIQKFQALPPSDRLKLVIYAVLLQFIHLGLNWFGYRKVFAYLQVYPRKQPLFQGQSSEALEKARLYGHLVVTAARNWPSRVTCLRQALLLFWLLRREGISTQLRIGVKRQGESIIAHAWVNYGEEVISGTPAVENSFTAFEDLTDRKTIRVVETVY